MTNTTVSAEPKPELPDATRKARRSVKLALVHVALAVGILALFVFMQYGKG